MMKPDEIIEMTRQAGGFSPTPEFIEAFAKLVEAKERKEMAEHCVEITRMAVDKAVASAIEKEREACANFVRHGYVRQFEKPWREDLSDAIRARGEA